MVLKHGVNILASLLLCVAAYGLATVMLLSFQAAVELQASEMPRTAGKRFLLCQLEKRPGQREGEAHYSETVKNFQKQWFSAKQ